MADPPTGQETAGRSTFGWRRFLWVLLAALAVNLLIVSLLSDRDGWVDVSYSEFLQQVEDDNVESVSIEEQTIKGSFRVEVVDLPGRSEPVRVFRTERPIFADDDVVADLLNKGVLVDAKAPSRGTSWPVVILVNFGPALLIVFGYLWLMRRATGAIGGIASMGKSHALKGDPHAKRVTFADVAGIDEAKGELVEIVDFLRSPTRYLALGARAPRGVLLMGPPGTGKTLLARAVAGEAEVPFFSVSAAEFIEMIVGVGASRVRDLFDQAKAVAPSIVFIDELDAIGRARGAGVSFGGVDEREQTLNQILTEMDGFSANEGVIVLAATNRPDVLDPALLRPGRFDRRIVLNPPDLAGRAAIIAVHTKAVPLADDVHLDDVAASTPGMVGADLANLVNEAALMAARRQHTRVTTADFTDALERIVLGAERKIMLTEDDRRRTAYHESGHALLGMLQEGADPVRKVSIIPRGRALGVTFQSPATDRYGLSEAYLRGRIIGALGGRVAEEIVFGDLTSGAEVDLEQVTSIARQMVGRWGMSHAVGPVSVLPEPEFDFGFMTGDGLAPSESTRQLVDSEIRSIVDDCHRRATEILRANRALLDRLANELLTRETLDEADAYAVVGLPVPPIVGR